MPEPKSQLGGMSQADQLEAKQSQDKHIINEAIDEFIQDKKSWFYRLHCKHGGDINNVAEEKGNEFLEGTIKYIGKG